MRNIIVLLFLLNIWTTRGQLNYEGNPLTENTEYTAEESHYSKRNDHRLTVESNKRNAKVIDSYIAAANSFIHDDKSQKSTIKPSSFDMMSANTRSLQTNDNVGVNTKVNMGYSIYQEPSIIQRDYTTSGHIQSTNMHIPNQRSESSNEIQITAAQQITPLPSPNEALDYFLKSQTPDESKLTLENYLRVHNQKEQISGQSDRMKINNQQNFIPSSQNINQRLQIDNSLNAQSLGRTSLIPNSYSMDQQIYHPLSSPISPASGVWHQMPIQNRRDFIPASSRQRRPLYNYYRSGGRPHHSRQRVQTRIGHGHYTSIHPPTLLTGGGGKSSNEIIYTKPPGFHGPPGPPTAISNPHIPYEDASAHFPESSHPPIPKDVYYSQLYSQSYDPYYYNYIAKTGKIKPWLYGKLGHKDDSGFWNELVHSFKNHGMKNMMNPMFLLGLSIPAVTLMLSAMVNKRSFNGRSSKDLQPSDWSWSKEDIENFHTNLLTIMQCIDKQKINGEDPTKCANNL